MPCRAAARRIGGADSMRDVSGDNSSASQLQLRELTSTHQQEHTTTHESRRSITCRSHGSTGRSLPSAAHSSAWVSADSPSPVPTNRPSSPTASSSTGVCRCRRRSQAPTTTSIPVGRLDSSSHVGRRRHHVHDHRIAGQRRQRRLVPERGVPGQRRLTPERDITRQRRFTPQPGQPGTARPASPHPRAWHHPPASPRPPARPARTARHSPASPASVSSVGSAGSS